MPASEASRSFQHMSKFPTSYYTTWEHTSTTGSLVPRLAEEPHGNGTGEFAVFSVTAFYRCVL